MFILSLVDCCALIFLSVYFVSFKINNNLHLLLSGISAAKTEARFFPGRGL